MQMTSNYNILTLFRENPPVLFLIIGGVLFLLSLLVFPIVIHDAWYQSANPYKDEIKQSCEQINNLITLVSGILLGCALITLYLNDKNAQRLRT